MNKHIKPLLSICIPTYNRSFYVQKLIKELIIYIEELPVNQNSLVEIIISDNKSDDDTVKKLKAISKNYQWINIHCNKTNIGFSRNLLKLISYANGKYIWFLGDDDKVVKNIFPKIFSLLKEKSPNFILLNYFTFVDSDLTDDKIINVNYLDIEKDLFFEKKLSKTFFNYAVRGIMFISTNIISTKIAKNFSKHLADNNYWHLYMILTSMVKYKKVFLYGDRDLGQRVMTSHFHKNLTIKFETFYKNVIGILLLFKKNLDNSIFLNIKKSFKPYVKISFYTLTCCLRSGILSKKNIVQIKKDFQLLYWDFYLFFLLLLIIPKRFLIIVTKFADFLRYIKRFFHKIKNII